jgi:fructokinase
MKETMWGIDLGGTKIEGIILRGDKEPETIVRTRVDTEAAQGYDHVIDQIEKLVKKMKADSGLSPVAIGFGTPGILDPITQNLKNSNTTILNHQPLKKDLEERLQLPVILANDANCFALAEATWGGVKKAAPRARMVFGNWCRRWTCY